jgi:hypothetical protein
LPSRKALPAVTVLAAVSLLSSAPRALAAVGAPVLKWAYGGCISGPYCQTGWYSSPAVVDLEGDGQPDVVWGAYDVFALNGSNGSLKWRGPNGGRVWPSVAVADLTGDGTLEVIVGRSSDQLTVYDRFGTPIWTRNPFGLGEVRTLAVADLDSNGQQEIVVGRAGSGATLQLNVFQADGTVRPGWPARRDGELGYGWGMYNENVAVADMNGDGFREVFGPTDTHYITALDANGNQLGVNGVYAGRSVWAQVGVHVDHAVDVRGYANCGSEHRPNFADSAPIVADLDRDGVPEMIVVGNVYNCGASPYQSLYHMPFIFRLDRTRWSGSGFNWTALPPPSPASFPRSEDYGVIETAVPNPAAADLDGDGFLEVVYPSYDGKVHAYWLDKTQHGSWPHTVPAAGGADDFRFASEVVVADLDNDGQAEVIFTSWPKKAVGGVGHLHVLSAQGAQLHRVPLPAPDIGGGYNGGLGAPTLANIDADPDLEVVVGTVASGAVAYDLPNTAAARILWSTGRGTVRRTGSFLRARLAVDDVSVLEGDSGTRNATFTVNMAAPSDAPASVAYSCTAGTATSGSDYSCTPGSLAFAPWQTSRTVAVTVSGDSAPEPNETFTLNLATPVGASIGDGQAVGAILDDDESAGYFPLAPCRLADTRGAAGPSGGPALASGTTRSVPAAGACGVPAEARAVVVIVTAVAPGQAGNFRVFPSGTPVPTTSVLNFRAARTRANNAVVSLGAQGQIAVRNDMGPGAMGTAHLVMDVFGYFR